MSARIETGCVFRSGCRPIKGMASVGFLGLLESIAADAFDTVQAALEVVGRSLRLFGSMLYWTIRPPFRFRELTSQIDFIGVQSVSLIVVTGAFTGMVLALQSFYALSRYGAVSLVGAGVALALCRELGPVLAALMVTARAGSAMTAELGSMRMSDQIDALASMAVEPVQYLVVPRVIAGTIVVPMLATLFEFAGMVGAYGVSTMQLGIEGGAFMASVNDYLSFHDVRHGLIKATVFGLLLTLIACAKGYYATGGARGVAKATTEAVVASALLILASDYLMTAMDV